VSNLSRQECEQSERLALDPRTFLLSIHVPTARGPRQFGSIVAEFQRERFAMLLPSLLAVARGERPPVNFFWIEATKGASKDSDLALCLLWLLLVSPRSLRLQIGAYDADQADEIRLIVKQVLRIDQPFNQYIAERIDVRADSIINRESESVAEILTRDSLGSHGARPDLVLINELSHITDKEFAETLLDNADKVETAVCVVATNAGLLDTWQKQWRDNALASSRWRCHVYSQPAPWVDIGKLEESRKRNPVRYNRLWRGVWSHEVGDALPLDLIEKAIKLPGPSFIRENGWAYFGGMDLAWRRDAAAIAIVAKNIGWWEEMPAEEQPAAPSLLARMGVVLGKQDLTETPKTVFHDGDARLKLIHVEVWLPENLPGGSRAEISFAKIEEFVADAHQRLGFSCIACESAMAPASVQRLQSQNVPIEAVPPSSPVQRAIADAVVNAFHDGLIDLFDHGPLIADLKALKLVENPTTGVKLKPGSSSESGGTPHGDAAIAFGHALLAARRSSEFVRSPVVNRPLICWP
jgi:hypothetical protein